MVFETEPPDTKGLIVVIVVHLGFGTADFTGLAVKFATFEIDVSSASGVGAFSLVRSERRVLWAIGAHVGRVTGAAVGSGGWVIPAAGAEMFRGTH